MIRRIGFWTLTLAMLLCVGLIGGCSGKTFTSQTKGDGQESSGGTENGNGQENSGGTENGNGQAGSGASYYADIEIQDYGVITVALDGNAAPITVDNFVSLAESGFYDGLTFHRIIAGFMMQGGDPEGTGFGGSDQMIVGEFPANGYTYNTLSHTRGTISMARAGYSYDSASSQFFIMQGDAPWLDGAYAAFGCVTNGMDVVDAVCEAAEPIDDNGTIPADRQPVISSITIRPME